MLTFTYDGNATLRCTGGGKPFNVYPKKPVSGEINLVVTPAEDYQEGIVSWPGEYDIAGVTIRGIGQLEGQQVSYVVQSDGYRIAFPAAPLQDWSEQDIERLGEVQVLCLPAKDAKKAQKLIDEVDPRILFIVPDADGKMDQELLKQCGAIGKEHMKEYKLKGALPAEGREVVVFG
jgi:hypothetical protein